MTIDENKYEKYIVLNKQFPNKEIGDAIVLRLQDRFAGPAIQAYADAVANAIEILELVSGSAPPSLYEVRDWAFHAAEAARSYPTKKLPDA